MPQRTVPLLEDDMDGDNAAATIVYDTHDVGPTENNAARMRDVLTPPVVAARRGGRPASTVQEPRRPERADSAGVR